MLWNMVHNLSPAEIHCFIKSDFLGAWNSIAANPDTSIDRGNFMFGRQAMSLLEFVSLLCQSVPTQKTLRDFSNDHAEIFYYIAIFMCIHNRFRFTNCHAIILLYQV